MCTRHFGSVVAQTIRTQKTDQFPLFLIIMGKRSSNEVLNVIQGTVLYITNIPYVSVETVISGLCCFSFKMSRIFIYYTL